MTLGLPIPLAFQSSNVVDPTPDIATITAGCNKPIIGKGFELAGETWIYEFTHEDDLVIPEWNQTDVQNEVYKIGDVVWRDCKLQVVTAKKGERWIGKPLEPEEYSVDTNFDPTQWSHRYFRLEAFPKNQWCQNKYTYLSKLYYLMWDACDRSCNGWKWVVKCTIPKSVQCHEYNNTCLAENYTTKYEAGKDVIGEFTDWTCTPSVQKEKIIIFKSMIERGGFLYFRTHLDIPAKRTPMPVGAGLTYTTRDVVSPEEIDGFIKRRKKMEHSPFDSKSYTLTDVNTESIGGYASWTLMASSKFDSIALSHIVADKVNIKFSDTHGNATGAITNYLIDNTVDYDTDIEHFSTLVLYAESVMPEETVITIEVWGSHIKIGEILGGETIDAGFTNLVFKNQYKDFSPKFVDQWGNIEYRDGVRVNEHSGSVDVPMVRYDQLNRLMLMIGAKKVILNSSDSRNNEVPNGHSVFEATMMIGRFTSFSMTSKMKDKRMDEVGTYSFNFREDV